MAIVLTEGFTLVEPASKGFSRSFLKADDPILCILRALLFRNAENAILYIDPACDGSFDFDGAQTRIQTCPNKAGELPTIRTFPVVRRYLGF